ncbi:hypothetical protein [Streptomyces sp. NBC_00503]|uniref:hypothetical protein n=1 Tax=Streptomyces sp. NBC_00503 TaxID=2903659 RepID=UPI002E80DEB9|nr:hypothetical protein [Streptomyces sp. NBC_00503]WUD84549.1 hypothetical protein OG490_30535 [Streptomyces sp. NBC_00503]
MKISKRIAATSAALLLGTLALGGGVAHAADGGGHGDQGKASYQKTIEAAPGTDHVAGHRIRPASEDNPASQTVQAKPGTPHTGAGAVASK